MSYVLDRYDSPTRSIHLRHDYRSYDAKIIYLTGWNGYEDEIQVIATDEVAVVTFKDGTIRQFDLTHGNVAVEIS